MTTLILRLEAKANKFIAPARLGWESTPPKNFYSQFRSVTIKEYLNRMVWIRDLAGLITYSKLRLRWLMLATKNLWSLFWISSTWLVPREDLELITSPLLRWWLQGLIIIHQWITRDILSTMVISRVSGGTTQPRCIQKEIIVGQGIQNQARVSSSVLESDTRNRQGLLWSIKQVILIPKLEGWKCKTWRPRPNSSTKTWQRSVAFSQFYLIGAMNNKTKGRLWQCLIENAN